MILSVALLSLCLLLLIGYSLLAASSLNQCRKRYRGQGK